MNQTLTLNPIVPSTPSLVYARKPAHLLSFLRKREDSQTAKKAFIIRSSSRMNIPTSLTHSPMSKSFNPQMSLSHSASKEFLQPGLRTMETRILANLQEETEKKSTVKFGQAMQLQKVTDEDKKEEAIERYLACRKYIKEIKQIRLFEDKEGRMLSKKKVLEESDKILKLAHNVFLAMNIRIKELLEPVSDSAMTIYPVEEKSDLADFYKKLVLEVFEFPYSFLVKIKIFMLTICEEASLFSPVYRVFLEQKMNNGLFILKDLQTEEEVRDHWYKIVACHFVKAAPTMFDEWKDFVRSENNAVIIRKSETKGELEELVLTLKCVMRPQDASKTNLPRLAQKVKFLKKLLKNFEPACFDEEWWDMKYNDGLFYQE